MRGHEFTIGGAAGRCAEAGPGCRRAGPNGARGLRLRLGSTPATCTVMGLLPGRRATAPWRRRRASLHGPDPRPGRHALGQERVRRGLRALIGLPVATWRRADAHDASFAERIARCGRRPAQGSTVAGDSLTPAAGAAASVAGRTWDRGRHASRRRLRRDAPAALSRGATRSRRSPVGLPAPLSHGRRAEQAGEGCSRPTPYRNLARPWATRRSGSSDVADLRRIVAGRAIDSRRRRRSRGRRRRRCAARRYLVARSTATTLQRWRAARRRAARNAAPTLERSPQHTLVRPTDRRAPALHAAIPPDRPLQRARPGAVALPPRCAHARRDRAPAFTAARGRVRAPRRADSGRPRPGG